MNRLPFSLAVIGLIFFLVAPAAVAQEPTADDYIEFWKPNIGTWKLTQSPNRESKSFTFTFRQPRNQKCFLMYGNGVQYLQGYDPVAKKGVVWGFNADGSCSVQEIAVDGLKKGMQPATAGMGGQWKTIVFGRDGNTTTTTAKSEFDNFPHPNCSQQEMPPSLR